MQTDTQKLNETITPNSKEIEILKKYFPQCFSVKNTVNDDFDKKDCHTDSILLTQNQGKESFDIEKFKELIAQNDIEIKGEGNFVDVLHYKRKKQPSFLAKHTAKLMEYVLVYAKNSDMLGKLAIETLSDATKKVVNLTNSESVRHFEKGVRVKCGNSGVISKGIYKIKTMQIEYLNDVHYESGRTINSVDVKALFSVSQEKIDNFIKDDLLFITVNMGLRRDVSEEEKNSQKSITDLLLDWGDNQDSEKEINELFESKVFDYSKPTNFVRNLVLSATNIVTETPLGVSNPCGNSSDIIIDFFSGSGTTAHAVMDLNASDNGKRKFIMVQLDENVRKDSEAEKAGYKTIDEIGRERIRRAAAKLKAEHPDKKADLGFKTYYLKPMPQNTIDKIKKFVPNELTLISSDGDIIKTLGESSLLQTWQITDGRQDFCLRLFVRLQRAQYSQN